MLQQFFFYLVSSLDYWEIYLLQLQVFFIDIDHLIIKIIATKGFGLWVLAIIFAIGGGYILFIFKTHYRRTELENEKTKLHDDFIETEKLIDNQSCSYENKSF